MATIAEQLRQAREAKNMTVEQVAEFTKMRTDHIRALEEGNYDVFSAPVYIKGFVRTCAALLKMDVPRVMANLDEELGKTSNFAEPPSLSGEPRNSLDHLMLWLSQVNWRKGLVGIVVLVIVAGGATSVLVWKHFRNSDPLHDLPPAVYRPAPANSGNTLPLPAPAPAPRR